MHAVARVPWVALLALLLALSSGCAAPRHGGGPGAGAGGAGLTTAASSACAHSHSQLEPTRRHHAVRAAIIAGVVFIIVGAFLVDLFLLPFSYRRRHMFFPCCRTVISWCD
ncbi:MAG: hypothetical protein M9894_02025 [Planctomycetes bacterium]|nr:hypothetical protein [Planctomycetota bacterium]